jgi:hypothetical protein
MTEIVITAKDPKPTAERIEQLAQRVLMGDIVLPEFQRPFVWKRKQILELLDSIFRNYPIGSALLWESHQKLEAKRAIADLVVGARSEKYPVNYLLDGQQRLSTICGALYWVPGDPKSVWNIVFDLRTRRFIHLDHADELPVYHVPLRRLKDPADYFRRLAGLDNEEYKAAADLLFNRFKDYQLPIVTLGDMSIYDVAPVFERINSTGTRLTIYDLMRAATWSPQFDLGATIQSIKTHLEPKRFHSFDNKTFLRALAAASGRDFSSGSMDGLRELKPEVLQSTAQAVKDASALAADFLSTDLRIPRSEALPYANQFAVLTEIFRVLPRPASAQLEEIRKWFWITTLSGYFSGWDSGQMTDDTNAIRAFAAGERKELGPGVALPNKSLWITKPFRTNSAASKMLAIMFGYGQPLDLLTGQQVDVDKSLAWSNDKEFHHFFPQAFLKRKGMTATRSNVVGNIVLLSSASNLLISDQAPSAYLAAAVTRDGRKKVAARLASVLIPERGLDAALADDYEGFLEVRAAHLHERAEQLAGTKIGDGGVAADEIDESEGDPTE